MAEVLSVDVSSFFRDAPEVGERVMFPGSEALEVKPAGASYEGLTMRALTPSDFNEKAEPFLVEIGPRKKIPTHFFVHKGEEVGYLISGKLEMVVGNTEHKLRSGDLVYLVSDIPSSWHNPGPGTAKILWMKLR
jgi:quercetin dioxygenase-like cupin family protein